MKKNSTSIDSVVGETDHHENTKPRGPRRDTLDFIRQFARVYCSVSAPADRMPGIVLN